MKRLTFINSYDQKITMGNTKPFLITKLEGTDAVNISIQSQKSPYQDGETYIGSTFNYRQITIEGIIWERDKALVMRYRQQLLRVLNPRLHECKLIYDYDGGSRMINCIADGAPIFTDKQKELFQSFLINLYCPDPFWRDVTESKEEIAVWKSAFEFPLEIVPEGIEMGYREPSLIVNIFNGGDVPCGMRIQFKALATVVNPSLFNINTREYFKINKTMGAGEIITVTTGFGDKRVELNKNGVVSNAFNWIDLNSTFLQLEPGDNLFRYDADDGIDNLEVSIYYTPQYLGV